MYVGMAGYYRLIVKTSEEKIKQDTGWFQNLITNQGLDWFGVAPSGYNAGATGYAGVGTGNTAPSFTDVNLTAPMTPAAPNGSLSQSYVAGPPAYWSNIYSYQWAQGAIVGNISEVGIGDLASHSAPYTGVLALASHALIVDANGNPTTLSVTATDTLSVTYELRLYLNTTDTNYSIVIGGTTYSGLFRLCQVGSNLLGWSTIPVNISVSKVSIFYYNGTIGTINSFPSGSNIGGNASQNVTWTSGTYTIGSYTIQISANIAANVYPAINITAIQLECNIGNWQFSVSPALVRLATQNISTTWALSWGRYTP